MRSRKAQKLACSSASAETRHAAYLGRGGARGRVGVRVEVGPGVRARVMVRARVRVGVRVEVGPGVRDRVMVRARVRRHAAYCSAAAASNGPCPSRTW